MDGHLQSLSHKSKDGNTPAGSVPQTGKSALKHSSQKKHQVINAMAGHIQYQRWSLTSREYTKTWKLALNCQKMAGAVDIAVGPCSGR